jgi:hypothetical protein
MAPTVVGSWELGYSAPLTESYLWAWPLRDFGVVDWRMWPVSGIKCPEQQVSLTEYPTIDDALAGLTGQRVYLEPSNGTFPLDPIWLHDFEHPEDAIYIFGSVYFNPTVGRLTENDLVVQMPTLHDTGVPFPHQICVAVLYDRLVKSWQ